MTKKKPAKKDTSRRGKSRKGLLGGVSLLDLHDLMDHTFDLEPGPLMLYAEQSEIKKGSTAVIRFRMDDIFVLSNIMFDGNPLLSQFVLEDIRISGNPQLAAECPVEVFVEISRFGLPRLDRCLAEHEIEFRVRNDGGLDGVLKIGIGGRHWKKKDAVK